MLDNCHKSKLKTSKRLKTVDKSYEYYFKSLQIIGFQNEVQWKLGRNSIKEKIQENFSTTVNHIPSEWEGPWRAQKNKMKIDPYQAKLL